MCNVSFYWPILHPTQPDTVKWGTHEGLIDLHIFSFYYHSIQFFLLHLCVFLLTILHLSIRHSLTLQDVYVILDCGHPKYVFEDDTIWTFLYFFIPGMSVIINMISIKDPICLSLYKYWNLVNPFPHLKSLYSTGGSVITNPYFFHSWCIVFIVVFFSGYQFAMITTLNPTKHFSKLAFIWCWLNSIQRTTVGREWTQWSIYGVVLAKFHLAKRKFVTIEMATWTCTFLKS